VKALKIRRLAGSSEIFGKSEQLAKLRQEFRSLNTIAEYFPSSAHNQTMNNVSTIRLFDPLFPIPYPLFPIPYSLFPVFVPHPPYDIFKPCR
jgi:hypothetical protein